MPTYRVLHWTADDLSIAPRGRGACSAKAVIERRRDHDFAAGKKAPHVIDIGAMRPHLGDRAAHRWSFGQKVFLLGEWRLEQVMFERTSDRLSARGRAR